MWIFSFDYPPSDGGIARLCAAIATGLAREHQPVSVMTQRYALQDGSERVDAAVKTVRIQPRRPWREWEAYRRLKKQRATSPMSCLSGIWYPEGLIAAAAGLSPRAILAHGAELFPPSQRWRQPIWKWLQKCVLESADVVIANSHYTERLVRAVAPAAHVVAAPLGVDHRFFAPGDRASARLRWQVGNQRVLCSVSRIQMFKGHDTVLQALAALSPRDRDQFVYLVAGKGSDLNALQEQARVLGVDRQVRWLGFVADEDLPELYRAADLFVLMTREQPAKRSVEGFGLVFLEAQACATPVVGTRAGGIPDAITHGDGGWLIEQDDVAGLTTLLQELASDPESFQAMGRLARQRVEREFTWEHYLSRLKQALRDGGFARGRSHE